MAFKDREFGLNQLTEDKVVCPHCWTRFYADEAFYISTHPALFGDEVVPTQNRRFSPRQVQRDQDGNALDPNGWTMAERACPTCHLQMPKDLLRHRPVFVSVVGAPRSGKTYFITSMIHRLRHELPRYFGYTLDDADSHDIHTFLEHEQALFHASDPEKLTLLHKTQEFGDLYHTVRLGGVDVQLPKPFIFALRPTELNIDRPKHGDNLNRDIVIYDNAGESFKHLADRNATNRVTQHLAESDVVLFTFDPLQDGDARTRLRSVSKDPQLDKAAVNNRQESTLAEVANRIRRLGDIPAGSKIESWLGICVQKYDVWRSLLPHSTATLPDGTTQHLLDHSSIEWDSNIGIGRLDVPEINRISLIVRSFVEDLCPQLVAFAETNFRVVRYFPISALGVSPHHDSTTAANDFDMLKVQPKDIQPFRVSHPMLWILQRSGLMRKIHRTRGGIPGVPTATIQQVTQDRIRLLAPGSGRVFVLDHDYADSSVVDPYCGQWMHIPAIPAAAASPSATASPAPTSPQHAPPAAKPPAVLTIETPKPRRGWFRK